VTTSSKVKVVLKHFDKYNAWGKTRVLLRAIYLVVVQELNLKGCKQKKKKKL
jgi:hypothetical protein